MSAPLALLFNDIHITKDNILEFNSNWDEMLSVCEEYKIQNVVIGGDLFTSRPAQPLSVLLAVQHAIRRATKMGLKLIIAEGNHDLVNQEEMEGYSHLFNDYKNVQVVDNFTVLAKDDGIILATMSYFPENGSFTKKLEALKDMLYKDWTECLDDVVLYIHEGIQGALGDFEVPNDLPTSIFKDFHSVLVGHYHNRVELSKTNISYIGSSRQHNFGEDEYKGYTILYLDGTTKFIQNKVNTRYVTMNVKIEDVNAKFMHQLKEYADDPIPYKVRVRISCTDAQAKNFDKNVLVEAGANKVEMVTEKTKAIITASSSIESKYDKNGIKKEYQAFCNSKNIDCELGMKYLDQIN